MRAEKKSRFGNPDVDRTCTSHIESFVQKFPMQCRRFARLTNAHSKSLKHHVAPKAIFFAFYNFCRIHSSPDKQTPAMAAGVVGGKLRIDELL